MHNTTGASLFRDQHIGAAGEHPESVQTMDLRLSNVCPRAPVSRLLNSGGTSRKAAGQAMVEFALVAPIFFILVFFIVESALLVNAQITIDGATREGARLGALCGGSIGSWTSPDGTGYSNGTVGSPCPQAIAQTVSRSLGFLRATGSNPAISSSAPAGGSPSYCSASTTTYAYYAPSGCVITVSVSYQYSYLLNFLVGPVAPSITLTSVAGTVSQ